MHVSGAGSTPGDSVSRHRTLLGLSVCGFAIDTTLVVARDERYSQVVSVTKIGVLPDHAQWQGVMRNN